MQLKNLKKRIWGYLRKPFFYKSFRKYDLIIYDDFFPNPITGFRLAEFSEYLSKFSNIKIIINPKTYDYAGLNQEFFLNDLNNYKNLNPQISRKIYKIKSFSNINCRLFYFIFLNNGRQIIKELNRLHIDFVFTLYPGGGLKLDNADTDYDLNIIMSSKYFKGVIVTQECTRKYLLDKKFCSADKIKFIPGIPIQSNKLNFDISEKNLLEKNKRIYNLCFVAAKNLKRGEDKGYDLFIGAAKIASNKFKNLRFHVIGGFSESDIDVSELADVIKFYNYIDSLKLPLILAKFDIIISPNRPGVLGSGSFDGFPLGSCVEASLVGCVMIVSDELSQNKYYKDGKEIFIIKPSVEAIMIKLEYFIANPHKIYEMGLAGMEKTKQLYSYTSQLQPRIDFLQNKINKVFVKQ